MLVDKIASAYWRAMRYEYYIHHLIEKNEEEGGGYSFNQLKVNILKEMHKGIDLANRELNINLTFLKELKQPKLNIKVKTENAYIAQNQQINQTQPNNSKVDPVNVVNDVNFAGKETETGKMSDVLPH